MKRVFALAVGELTAIGGFMDIGDIVTNAATFEIIRERLGPRLGAANLIGSVLVTALTLTAELGGITLALQLATGVSSMLWLPVAAFAVWIILWRVKFKVLENVTGSLGLCLIVFVASFVVLAPAPGDVVAQILHPSVPENESALTYWYYAVAQFGAAMTPYEVFFFSSGAVEDRWTVNDLGTARFHVALISFILAGALILTTGVDPSRSPSTRWSSPQSQSH